MGVGGHGSKVSFNCSHGCCYCHRYGEDWTRAYVAAVANRCASDVFRILGVRFMEPLIFECISYT